MAVINPYLNFNGNCEEAFNFYRSVFGGEFTGISRFKEVPSDVPGPEVEGEWIMHIELPIGKGTVLMGSDSPSAIGEVVNGTSYHLSVQTDNNEETDRLYAALSDGGKISMPLDNTFWGARFAMFTDRFGIQWMINQDLGGQN